MRNSLNLGGDGDDLDVVRDVERTFGISIGREAESIHTVGALYDLVQAKCGTVATRACLSQIAFYRLRRALASLGKGGVTPATSIRIVLDENEGPLSRRWVEIGRRAGLTLPPLEMPFRFSGLRLPAAFTWLVWLLAVGAFVTGTHALALSLGLTPGAAWIIAIIGIPAIIGVAQWCLYLVFRDIPRRVTTIGDLACEAAGYTFRELQAVMPAPSPADRWHALLAILRRISGYKPTIDRDTTFFTR
jgi:hypothetical protein